MNGLRPRVIATWISIILSVFITLSVYLFNKFYKEDSILLILMVLIFFLIIFLITSYCANKLIEKRLKPIFKIIRDVPVEEVRKAPDLTKQDSFIVNVNDEVTKWATGKQEEIQKLKELERYRKEFVGNVSHELKTPIFNIQGYILTLLDGGIDDPRIISFIFSAQLRVSTV